MIAELYKLVSIWGDGMHDDSISKLILALGLYVLFGARIPALFLLITFGAIRWVFERPYRV